MTEINGKLLGGGSQGSSDDLIPLTDAAAGAEGGNSSQDSILNAAQVFEAQLEQMSNWKHQLAQQMEIMRRDGIKLLERQKNLAVERKRLADERDSLVADRQQLESLQAEMAEQTNRLRAKESELDAARAALEQLDGERQRWERELAQAQQQTESLEARRRSTESQLQAAETRLEQIAQLTEQRDALLAEIAGGRASVADLQTEAAAAEAVRGELAQREAALVARERGLAEQEASQAAERNVLRESIEQLEEQRRQLLDAQRALVHEQEVNGARQDERWNALEARAAELGTQEEACTSKAAELASRETQLREEKRSVEEAQSRLFSQQEALIQAERGLAQRKLGVDGDVEERLAAAEKARAQVEEERQLLIKQRHELEKKLDDMENELTGQLDMLAKQTKRLTERRGELESRSAELENEFAERLARETQSLRDEMEKAQRTYEQRATFLQQQLDQQQAGAQDLASRDAAWQADLEAVGEQLVGARLEVQRLTRELGEANLERTDQAKVLAEQVMRYENDAAEWQRKLDEAILENSERQVESGEPSVPTVDVQAVQSELEQALQRLENAEGQRAALQQQLTEAGALGMQQAQALARQVDMLERQRNDLAAQLFTVQDILRRQTDESLLAKNSLEGELLGLRRRNQELEAERTTWQSQQVGRLAAASAASTAKLDAAGGALGAHRDRLLRQAKTLRAYRKQVRESRCTLEQSRVEIAQQREQLRSRKENLEQVKRLLEKQEMVMARKLADHNALKTVAAVGIFVIMVLGSVFLGVYKFVSPLYRSEAVVQLVPPPASGDGAPMQGQALQTWLNHQMEFTRTEDVTFTAWKILRTPDEHYAMHDVREEWIGSLAKNLSLQLDPGTKTMAVRYTGTNAEGVAQVCNAIATAYATPAAREGTPENNRAYGAGANVLAKAMPPMYPTEDNRLMLSLSVVASVLFVSLLLVMVFRHYVARQLREIDQMADDQDLEDLHGEMPAEVRTA